MADRNTNVPPLWFWVATGIAALLIGVGIIVPSFKIAAGTAPQWMTFVIQLLITVLALVLGALGTAIALNLASSALENATKRIGDLERRYPKQLAQARKRTPTLVVVALLVSEAIVIIADSSFEGKTVATLTVSFVMLLGFWAANEMMVKAARLPRIAGYFLWFLVILFLPFAIMLDRGWSAKVLGQHLWSLPMRTRLFFGLAGLVTIVLPVLMSRIDDAE